MVVVVVVVPSIAKKEGVESAFEPPAVIAAAIGETVTDAVAVDGAENGVIARTTAPETQINQPLPYRPPLNCQYRSQSALRCFTPEHVHLLTFHFYSSFIVSNGCRIISRPKEFTTPLTPFFDTAHGRHQWGGHYL